MEQNNNISKMLYFEKYVNETFLSTYHLLFNGHSEIKLKYLPNSNEVYLPLLCYNAPTNEVLIFGDRNDPILDDLLHDNNIKFYLHPQLENRQDIVHLNNIWNKERLPNEKGICTSSMRTIVLDGKKYAVKLHLPISIANVHRSIGKLQIEHNIRVSSIMENITHPKFAILPEILGVCFPKKEHRSWGYIVRSLVPRPYLSNNESYVLVPGFSLFSKYKYYPDRKPYLTELIENSNCDARKFIIEEIIYPVIEYWLYAFKTWGYLIEPHGQNLLFEIESDRKIHRLVLRDLDPQVHVVMRKRLGLSVDDIDPDMLVGKEGSDRPFGADVSIRFDSGFCKYLLDPITNLAKEYYQIEPCELEKVGRDFFIKNLPDYAEYFPSCVYDDDDIDPITHYLPVKLIDEKPRWRP